MNFLKHALPPCVFLIAMPTSPVHALSCETGPYIIFFHPDNAYVDAEAMQILEIVRNQADDCGYGKAVITGHSDTSENARVAAKRAEVVRAYFIGHGIPKSDISTRNLGSTRPRVATASNVSEAQNRRVEIIWYPNSK